MDNNPSDKKSSTSAGVDNHKIINSNTDTMQTGGLFNGKVFPAPAGTYIGTTTSNTNTSQNIKNSASRNAPSIANGTYEKNGVVIERETYNEGEKLQIEEVIKYQKQVIDNNGKSPVHGQNTKQIPTSPISTVKDSGLPGCKASAVPTEHDTIKIDATARSNSECDSETKVNHQKQTFIKTCSIFDSNQKETRQDNQDAIHSLQSGSPTPIPGKKILGNRSPIFCSKHKGKIALVVKDKT